MLLACGVLVVVDELFSTPGDSGSMDSLPNELLWEILARITRTADRNSVSLTCKRLHELDGKQRSCLRVGCGLNPANEALKSLCTRFPNLKKVEICYSGWKYELGKQLEDQGLLVLATHCPSLEDLTLSYCTYITDSGVSCLASNSKLSSLKLNFAPSITGCGIFSVVVGCKNLMMLHLVGCLSVTSGKWLEYLGKFGTLEHFSVKDCKAIREGDLIKLGYGWRKLKSLQFEIDANYRCMKFFDQLAVDRWKKQLVPCENMLEMSLVNCIVSPGRGLACVMGNCKNLQRILLDNCIGLRDKDIVDLAQKSTGLRSIFLRVDSGFSIPLLIEDPLILTDESLKALATYCPMLESVQISFLNGDSPSFSLDGISALIRNCPLRELSLDRVYSFNDVGMKIMCSAPYLQSLELVKCREISDKGLQLVRQFPRLRMLRLSKCLRITDDGFRPLVGSSKLELLTVEDCPQISERGLQGAAKSLCFKQDLSWMC